MFEAKSFVRIIKTILFITSSARTHVSNWNKTKKTARIARKYIRNGNFRKQQVGYNFWRYIRVEKKCFSLPAMSHDNRHFLDCGIHNVDWKILTFPSPRVKINDSLRNEISSQVSPSILASLWLDHLGSKCWDDRIKLCAAISLVMVIQLRLLYVTLRNLAKTSVSYCTA